MNIKWLNSKLNQSTPILRSKFKKITNYNYENYAKCIEVKKGSIIFHPTIFLKKKGKLKYKKGY